MVKKVPHETSMIEENETMTINEYPARIEATVLALHAAGWDASYLLKVLNI